MKEMIEELRQAAETTTPLILGDGTAVSWLTDKGESFLVVDAPLIQIGDWLVVKREPGTT